MPNRSIAVFDLGGVLIDWNPRYLYRKLFAGDEAAMEHFLANICTPDWNACQDAGRSFAEACAALKQQHPAYANLIDAWPNRHGEMLGAAIPGSAELLAELRNRSIPLYAISNWSEETFPTARRRFEFLQWFRGILLSGEVRINKPDPRIFQILFERFGIDPSQAVYIDDLAPNVEAAKALGMHGILFQDAVSVRNELLKLGLVHPAGDIASWVS